MQKASTEISSCTSTFSTFSRSVLHSNMCPSIHCKTNFPVTNHASFSIVAVKYHLHHIPIAEVLNTTIHPPHGDERWKVHDYLVKVEHGKRCKKATTTLIHVFASFYYQLRDKLPWKKRCTERQMNSQKMSCSIEFMQM